MLKEISVEKFYQNIKNENIDTSDQEYQYINNSLNNIQNPKLYIESQCSFDKLKDIIQNSVEIQFYIAQVVKDEIIAPDLTEKIYHTLITEKLLSSITCLYRDVYTTKTHLYFYNIKYEAKIVFLNLWTNKMLNKWIMYYILDGECDTTVSTKNKFYEFESDYEKEINTEQESFVKMIETLRKTGANSIPINRRICEIENDKNLQRLADLYNIMVVFNNYEKLCRPELIIANNE